MPNPVTTTIDDGIAVIRMDDGKANAIGTEMLAALNQALDQAEAANAAVLLLGRSGRFSGGFDLSVMRAGADAGVAMVKAGGELSLRLGRFPAPVVVGCTGHAMAMGAILLLSADARIGIEGDFKICFNEVAIGMTTPVFLIEQARERLSKRHFYRATVTSEMYNPATAVDAGFLDQLVPEAQLEEVARAETKRLAELPRAAMINTRARARSATLDKIEKGLAQDVAGLFGGA